MGVLDAIVLVPAHLVRNERSQDHSFFHFGLHSLIQVEQSRRIASYLCVVEWQAVDLSLEYFLPPIVGLFLWFVGHLRVILVLSGGRRPLSGRVEDRRLHILFLPHPVVIILKGGLLIDPAGIEWSSGDGLWGGGQCGLVALVIFVCFLAEGGMWVY